MNQVKLVLVLLIVGIGCLAFGVYVYLHPKSTPILNQTEARTEEPKPKQPPKILKLEMLRFRSYSWDEYGPGYDEGNPQHLYMRATGSITYNVAIAQTIMIGNEAEVSGKLSSELNNTTSSDIAFSSDITLLVNGKEQSTQNVIPDDGKGVFYSWKVPVGAFIPNKVNEITFLVKKTAFYKNGIVFYSPIQVKFEE
jgi:hypothetical protein